MKAKHVTAQYFPQILSETVSQSEQRIRAEVKRRGYQGSVELKNASLKVLAGRRHGKIYKIRNGRTARVHQASAAGESPAAMTGALRLSWRESTTIEEQGKHMTILSEIESNLKYAGPLEYGRSSSTTKNGKRYGAIAPRPYRQNIPKRAKPFIIESYGKAYD